MGTDSTNHKFELKFFSCLFQLQIVAIKKTKHSQQKPRACIFNEVLFKQTSCLIDQVLLSTLFGFE